MVTGLDREVCVGCGWIPPGMNCATITTANSSGESGMPKMGKPKKSLVQEPLGQRCRTASETGAKLFCSVNSSGFSFPLTKPLTSMVGVLGFCQLRRLWTRSVGEDLFSDAPLYTYEQDIRMQLARISIAKPRNVSSWCRISILSCTRDIASL